MSHLRFRTALLGFASALAMAPAALAQATSEPVDQQAKAKEEAELEEIVVTGFRKSITDSIATKRSSSSIVEAVSAEEIGKLPDISIAESLGRLPGLATQRLDGRSQVISIRGLGPDLSTALLNGREQVSTGDNRGVEFDQYPSELMAAAVVYKTPDATLIGQGLAGTVDMRTIRPLDRKERILSANARYEFNEDGSLNPDAPSGGIRGSATYVDQFANDTLGVALGVAYQSTPTQSQRFNAWGYPNFGDGGPLVIGGAKPFAQSNDLNRFGVIGTLEYEPTTNFRTALDLYYSNFDEKQVLRGIEFPLQWSSAQLQPGYTVEDGLITEGVFAGVKGVMRNDLNKREAELFAAGWNMRFNLANDWALETDLSYSRADRKDVLLESYSGTGPAGTGATDALGFALQPNGVVVFSPSLDYANPNLFVLTDPQGWGGGAKPNPLTQAGFINSPDTEDELTHLRMSVDRPWEIGPVSAFKIGVDLSRRDKQRAIRQEFLTPPTGTTSAPIPAAALLDKTVALDFIGIPGQVTYDPLYVLNNVLVSVPAVLSSFNVPQDWQAREDVLVGFAKFEVDSEVGAIPVNGNFGLQVVYTDQTSSGFRVEDADPGAGITEPTLIAVTDGDSYTRFLPSLNLSFHLADDSVIRLGAARTLARARMDQLNAGLTIGTDLRLIGSTDPNQAYFRASGGNPKLRPTIANAVDISYEKYFGKGDGYFALAAYYKDLQDFVNPNDAFLFDFANFVDAYVPADRRDELGTTLGIISGPTNRGGGSIRGLEASLSLPAGMIAPALEGFGVIVGGSFTDSKVLLGDSTVPITVPGLSKWVVNTTAYYEKSGFQARLSHRYRTDFLAEVSGISATRILRSAKGESIFDAQIGYAFQEGVLEGLSIVLQAYNLTNEPFITFQEPDPRLVIDQQRYGRTYLIGASYTF
ncbi:MAG: TonB-dependent receptor [Pseudomonadota bacterium]